MNINQYIKDRSSVINKALNGFLPTPKTKPRMIHKAMRYAVFPGGKRIRPILAVAAFEACGGKDNKILPIACAVEIIHTYTLIHDDLPCMDDDDYRRGKLSCHKKFGEALALLAGDALLTLGFQLLAGSGKIDIVREVSMAIGTGGTIGGQVEDILKQKPRKKELDYIASHKTGELFGVSVKLGGMLMDADKKKIDSLCNFGKNIGLTFQLVDDLIDGDGYTKLYGIQYVKRMAALLNDRAKSDLGIFGKKADKLSAIADLILKRKI